MPLPGDDLPWPLPQYAAAHEEMREYSAWYGGNPGDLARVYGGLAHAQYGNPNSTINVRRSAEGTSFSTQIASWMRRTFWGKRTDTQQQQTKLHAPVAADLAVAGADLLYAEPLKVVIPEGDTRVSTIKATQDRLDVLLDRVGWATLLLEAGEVGAALGGYGLRAGWDFDVAADRPLVSVVHGDNCIPEYSFGVLMAVTFWREVAIDGQSVWRQFERHERGLQLNALYKGTPTSLGKRRPLSDQAETRNLDPEVETIPGRLCATYVPNVRPNRINRHSPYGRSDYQGAVGFMDAYDETWSSWMRDIRLAKGRIIVPQMFLTDLGPGQGASFDEEREIFTGLPGLAQNDTSSAQGLITLNQFAIRVEEHSATCAELLRTILRTAGYSPSTFGMMDQGTGAVTAREITSRDRRSLITREKKLAYQLPELREFLFTVMLLDAKLFPDQQQGAEPVRPNVQPAPGVQESAAELAETVDLWNRAEAASIWVRVRAVHPDWTKAEVDEEVDRIKAEREVADPLEFKRPEEDDGDEGDPVVDKG